MNFEGKTVWITGASSGIGEALAGAFAARGARLVLSGRREAELQRVADATGGEALVLPFEATDYDALPAAVERAIGWQGGVDVLVNNAGISQRSLALDTEFDVYRRIIEIDFFAPLRLTQLVLPHMVERRSGLIAAVSSVAGKLGSPLRTGYCAAKHAVVGYFDALRAEVEAAYGVQVAVITPGFVRTPIATNAIQGDGSTRGHSDDNIDAGMDVGRCAAIILDGLEAGRREIPVGEGAEMGALQLRAADPDRLFDMLAAQGKQLAEARG
jgi:short-subunit dehydrogenase